MKKLSSFISLIFVGLSLAFLVTGCNKNESSQSQKTGITVSSVEEFKQALASGSKSLLTADLDFNHETITINHDVAIDSIDNQSNLKNVYLNIVGPTVVGEKIDVSFSNLIFDDTFDASSINFQTEESFEDKFGSTRENNICIQGNNGYFSLSLDNCVIKNYAAEVAPAIQVLNVNLEDYKTISLNNCKIYNNYSMWDTVQLSHAKMQTSITNCEFYSNYAYKAAGFSVANGTATIDKVNVHDNHFVSYDIDTSNPQLCGGGIFLGGNELKMTNSYIVNNKTTYGGGLGLSTAYTGNKYIVLENITIKNNEATYGGGVAIHSLAGQPVTFIDCAILNNKATNGGPLYTEVYGRWIQANNGGLVQFFFTTFGLNRAEDNNSFKFYKEEQTKGELGNIVLKGCFAIGSDTYDSSSDDYNYVATKEQALLDGVIDEDSIINVSNGLFPIKGSKADIKVSSDIYHSWSETLSSYSGDRYIGASNPSRNENKTPVTLILILSISGGTLIVILVVLVIVFAGKSKKKNIIQDTQVEEKDMRPEYISTLSEREKKVVELLIAGKKRKDIANELSFSENTIKRDLTVIYSKLHVADKFELILKYKDLF